MLQQILQQKEKAGETKEQKFSEFLYSLDKKGEITKEERRRILAALKAFQIPLKKLRPIEEAIITSGGIKISEIDPKTMASKLIQGLYFAGEIIDCDAYTGGFNLQIAWATAYAAGMSV